MIHCCENPSSHEKPLKSLDDRHIFIAVLCMLFYSVISNILYNKFSIFNAGFLTNLRPYKIMIFIN